MPWLVTLATTLVAFLADAIKGIAGRLMVALGIGIVTATGINAALNYAMQYANVAAIGDARVQQAMAAVGVNWFISTIISAVSTRLTLKGLSSDAVSFWILRKTI